MWVKYRDWAMKLVAQKNSSSPLKSSSNPGVLLYGIMVSPFPESGKEEGEGDRAAGGPEKERTGLLGPILTAEVLEPPKVQLIKESSTRLHCPQLSAKA